MIDSMLKSGSKPKWGLPFLMLLIPGSCYLYAAVFPRVRLDFIILGIIVTISNVFLASWRVVAPQKTESHLFRVIAAQGFTLATLLISYQCWLAFVQSAPFFIAAALLLLYFVVWLFPFFSPPHAQMIYQELWHPESKTTRILIGITLSVSVVAGIFGLIGKSLFGFGDGRLLLLAIIATIALVGGNFYLSSYIWREKHGMNPYPSSKEFVKEDLLSQLPSSTSRNSHAQEIFVKKYKKRTNNIKDFGIFLGYLFSFISFAGLLISVVLYLVFLINGATYSELQYIISIVFLVMFSLTARITLGANFRHLPWYAKVIPAIILIYGIWHLSMGSFGDLNKMPLDVRTVAKYHQTIFMHSFVISGYTLYCFLWSYINQKKFS
jgi:hypothetical protein